MALEDYFIDRIDYALATKIVVKHHYLHRAAPCSHAFGLFYNSPDQFFPKLVGVVIYGTPSSSTLREGICGKEYKYDVIELTRLWIDDSVPKNGESYLIGNTLSLIDKDIVVSYADKSMGHVGIVYQATNWIYTGLSAKRTDWDIEGISLHSQSLSDKYTAKEIEAKFGDSALTKDRPRKHRYVFFRGDKKRRKELLAALNYKIQPYPKGTNNGQSDTKTA